MAGCSRCRFSRNGCTRCRNPDFKPRRSAGGREHAQLPSEQVLYNSGNDPQAAARQHAPAGYQRTITAGLPTPEPVHAAQAQHLLALPDGHSVDVEQECSTLEKSTVQNLLPESPEPVPCFPPEETGITGSPDPRADDSVAELSTGACAVFPEHTNFMQLLHDNMAANRQRRLGQRLSVSSPGLPSPLAGIAKKRKKLPSSDPNRTRHRTAMQVCSPDAQVLQAAVNPRINLWTPPQSPFSLLEEVLYDDPWKLLLACMLLNKTSCKQVRKILSRLFELCPTPEAAVQADVQAIQDIIQPLGLFRKRAVGIKRFSEEYLHKPWSDPTELHGIGKYAADAYEIFCRGNWRQVRPDDKDLRRYHDWLASTDGLGAGLTRDPPLVQHNSDVSMDCSL